MIHNSGACFYVRMRRRTEDKYTVKVSTSPVSGYKCYSVFRNGESYFTIDGERVSGV